MSEYERYDHVRNHSMGVDGVIAQLHGKYVEYEDVKHLIEAEKRRNEAAKIVRDAEAVYRAEAKVKRLLYESNQDKGGLKRDFHNG